MLGGAFYLSNLGRRQPLPWVIPRYEDANVIAVGQLDVLKLPPRCLCGRAVIPFGLINAQIPRPLELGSPSSAPSLSAILLRTRAERTASKMAVAPRISAAV